MAVKISELPAAGAAAGTDQLEANQSGTSRRLTVAQVATHVRSSATDTVVVAAGSAAAPSIAPTGDSNTGIFFPAADTIAFSEGGVEAMRLDSSGNATFAGTAAMASSFLRNRIINGGFDVWQRGTSTSTNFAYLADRWMVAATGSITGSQSSDVPSSAFRFSLSVSGTNTPQTLQRIESVNCLGLVGQSVTVSFWVKQTSGAGTNSMGAQILFPTTTDNYAAVTGITTNLITATSGWTYVTTTFSSLPAAAVNGIQLLIYATTAGSATFLVTGVQLEVGSAATPFERRQYGTELMLCQRYFQSYAASTFRMDGNAASGGVSVSGITFSFHTQMRATPTATGAYSSTVNIGNGPFFGVTVNGTNIGANASSGGTTSMIMGAMTFAAEL